MLRVHRRLLSTVKKPSGAPSTKLYINGEFIESETKQWYELRNPVSIDNCRPPTKLLPMFHKLHPENFKRLLK
jgi:hypothetical protein